MAGYYGSYRNVDDQKIKKQHVERQWHTTAYHSIYNYYKQSVLKQGGTKPQVEDGIILEMQ